MANIYLDANCLVDLIEKRDLELANLLAPHQTNASILSIHILCYLAKYSIPSKVITELEKNIRILAIPNQIIKQSITGPSADLEDNLQLWSAKYYGCDYFLTRDQKILKNTDWHLINTIERNQLKNLQ